MSLDERLSAALETARAGKTGLVTMDTPECRSMRFLSRTLQEVRKQGLTAEYRYEDGQTVMVIEG